MPTLLTKKKKHTINTQGNHNHKTTALLNIEFSLQNTLSPDSKWLINLFAYLYNTNDRLCGV